jgi:molybdopterin-biosynthesis enzyme MoeA-like protein
VPEGARLLTSTASPWPVAVFNNVWILPGIPEVFRMKLPIIREQLESASPFITRSIFTKMYEPDLKAILDDLVRNHPNVEIGSYPAWSNPKYRTKITFDGKDSESIGRAMQDLLALLPEGEPQWID